MAEFTTGRAARFCKTRLFNLVDPP
jgi:hypothetical protein